MGDAATFERLIHAEPANDAPRLMYADWLDEQGDPRGEFIRVQCALAALPRSHPLRAGLRRKERRLQDAHGSTWTQPFQGLAERVRFRRGFVEEAALPAAQFVDLAPALFALAPIRRLRLTQANGELAVLAGNPLLRRLATLDLCGNELTDREMEWLARSPNLGSLRRLDLGVNVLTPAAVKLLAENSALSQLRAIDLSHNAFMNEAATTVLARSSTFENLVSLDLGINCLDIVAIEPLLEHRKLERLIISRNAIRDDGAAKLAGSPIFKRLTARWPMLDWSGCELGPAAVQALVASPHLGPITALDFSANHIGDDGVTALTVATNLPHLKSLKVPSNGITDEGAESLAQSPLLSRLRFLDLRDNALSSTGVRAIDLSEHRCPRIVSEFAGNVSAPPVSRRQAGDGPIQVDVQWDGGD